MSCCSAVQRVQWSLWDNADAKPQRVNTQLLATAHTSTRLVTVCGASTAAVGLCSCVSLTSGPQEHGSDRVCTSPLLLLLLQQQHSHAVFGNIMWGGQLTAQWNVMRPLHGTVQCPVYSRSQTHRAVRLEQNMDDAGDVTERFLNGRCAAESFHRVCTVNVTPRPQHAELDTWMTFPLEHVWTE